MSGNDRELAPPAVRVLVVDDHPMVREGLRQLIQSASDMTVCGVAESGAEALERCQRLEPDLVVLDLSMRDSDGTQLIRDILQQSWRTRVLVLSSYEASAYAERCLRAGARGYLNKRAAAQDIRNAIRVVVEGGLFLSEDSHLDEASLGSARRGPRGTELGPEALSDRELEVFQLLGRGFGPSQIAESMGVSVKTVEGYCARMRTKLRLAGSSELSRHAIEWYRGPDR